MLQWPDAFYKCRENIKVTDVVACIATLRSTYNNYITNLNLFHETVIYSK